MPSQKKTSHFADSRIKLILFLAFCIFGLLFMLIGMIPVPDRATPFGFGADAPMTHFIFEQDQLSISYPKSWNLHLTPYGNHGDDDVMAVITVPWHSLPKITIYRKQFSDENLSAVVSWREELLKTANEYKSISVSPFLLGDIPSEIREYTKVSKTLLGDAPIHCRDLYVSRNSVGYAISFCSDANDWSMLDSIFNKIILSINFLE